MWNLDGSIDGNLNCQRKIAIKWIGWGKCFTAGHLQLLLTHCCLFIRAASRRVPLVEKELFITRSICVHTRVFSGVRVIRSLALHVCFVDRLYFFFWPLCCLFFFDKRILITPLASLLWGQYMFYRHYESISTEDEVWGRYIKCTFMLIFVVIM